MLAQSSNQIREEEPLPLTELPRDQKIRLILCDFDGTFANDSGGVDPLNVQGFCYSQKLGIPVAFCTGRGRASVMDVLGDETLEKMKFKGCPGVYCNGAVAIDPSGEVLYETLLPREVQERMLSILKRNGLLDYALGVNVDESVCQHVNEWSTMMHTAYGERFPTVVPPNEGGLSSKSFCKIMICQTPEVLTALRREVERELGTSLHITRPYPTLLEVTERGFDKGRGLRALAQCMRIDERNILALGDSENDIRMFNAAGVAVVVSSGSSTAKAAAQYQTEGPGRGPLLEVIKALEKCAEPSG